MELSLDAAVVGIAFCQAIADENDFLSFKWCCYGLWARGGSGNWVLRRCVGCVISSLFHSDFGDGGFSEGEVSWLEIASFVVTRIVQETVIAGGEGIDVGDIGLVRNRFACELVNNVDK